jgi:hypothetical protein
MPRLHAPVLLPAGGGQGFGGVVFLGLAAVLAVMSCFKYLALHTTVSGLGLLLSDLYTIHADGAWWRAFSGHSEPLLVLFAQVYRLVPDQAAPFVLLTVQALVLALPALATARRYGLLAALAYALYFPVWTNALNGFHLDQLLVPGLFAFLLAARTGRFGLAACLGLLPALVGEYHALTTVCCGLYLFAVHERHPAGLLLMVGGALYLYVAVFWLIPFCSLAPAPTQLTALFQAWFGRAAAGWNLAACLGALLFFPLFRPKLLLPALPSLALVLFAGPATGELTGPVTAGLAGPLFFGFCEVLGPVRVLVGHSGAGARRFGLAVFLALALVHILVSPSPISRRFLTGDDFAFGLAAYEPTARDAAILAEILRSVPDDDAVAVASQDSLNWGALAERRYFGSFPQGVFEPRVERDLTGASWKDFLTYLRSGGTVRPPEHRWLARYVLLDTTRPWAVLSRECPPGDACRDPELAREYTELVSRARLHMEAVYDQGGFLLLRRRPEPAAPAPPAAPVPPADAPAGEAGTDPATAPRTGTP